MSIQSASLQGRRKSNEDYHIHYNTFSNNNRKFNSIVYMGVFDGHGGKGVSKYLKENLPKYFLRKNNNLYKNTKYTSKYIYNVYDTVQSNLMKIHPRLAIYSGSTAVSVILTKTKK